MRYLVLSDIHANLHALNAVLADAGEKGYDQVLVLGDLVGYGGDPAAAIEKTLALQPAAIVRGNHDKVAAGIEPATNFSQDARAAVEWTSAALTKRETETLAALPMGPRAVTDDLTICHGSPFDEDYYIFSTGDANRAMRHTPTRLTLFGHTHVPAVFSTTDVITTPSEAASVVRLPRRGQLLVNVGAVGQPRDGDPRAAYGILDTSTGTLHLHRVEYDVKGAQLRIREAGLPEWLAERLAVGR
jgi:diadenosine tetraphosphatase ApaH/serine/threonine PP2A family protein phosphatase